MGVAIVLLISAASRMLSSRRIDGGMFGPKLRIHDSKCLCTHMNLYLCAPGFWVLSSSSSKPIT